MVVEIKIKEVDVNFEDRELDPETKKLIEELSEGLQPGEDWLHYDRDRLFPPPPAPPSEATEHIVTTMPRTGSQRRDDEGLAAADAPQPRVQLRKHNQEPGGEEQAPAADAPKRRARPRPQPQRRVRSAPTLDSVPLPFVPENARQAQIVRRRKLRQAALIALALVGLGGAVAAMWLAMQQLSAEPAPSHPQAAPTAASTSTAASSAAAAAPASVTAASAAQPTARAAVTSGRTPPQAAEPSASPRPHPAVAPPPQPGVRPAPAATAPSLPGPSAVTPAPAPTSAPAPTKHMPGEGQW